VWLDTDATGPLVPVAGTTGQYLGKASSADYDVSWQTVSGGAPNQNYLINGSFAVAQRGTSFTSTNNANNDDVYTLDRWYILSDGNDAIDVTQETSTVPTNGQFAIALDVETVNKKFGIAQIIENKNCLGLIGNTVTLSFKAKVSATTKLDNVKAAIVSWSGTADTVTSDIISAWGAEGTNPTLIANATFENTPANLNVTTSYATYSLTANIDTASTKNIIVFIWSDVTDTTAGDFLYISETKLEVGSSASNFTYAGNSFTGEFDECQRYYQVIVSGDNKVFGMGWNFSTTEADMPVTFVKEMRTTPTASVVSGTNYYQIENGTVGDSFNTMILQKVSTSRGNFYSDPSTTSGLTQYRPGYFVSANAAAFIAVQAEL
jgi:hypothetical protein